MKFYYRPSVAVAPISGDGVMLLRPTIEVEVHGPSGRRTMNALVDTGADLTIFPLSLAQQLGIDVSPSDEPTTTDFSGTVLTLEEGKAEFELNSPEGDETLRWNAVIQFIDFGDPDDDTAVLGHVGFLNYFTAVFDGEQASLELIPNGALPIA